MAFYTNLIVYLLYSWYNYHINSWYIQVPYIHRQVFTIAVPTTAGTAAEATINYVISDVERKRKFVCVDVSDIPDIAIVDPEMMASMPKGLTAATGMAFSNVGLGIAHSMAHTLGAVYDTPHVVACAMMLPIVME